MVILILESERIKENIELEIVTLVDKFCSDHDTILLFCVLPKKMIGMDYLVTP